MSSTRSPRSEPTRSRTAADLEQLGDSLRITRLVAMAALVVAVAALGFAAVQLLVQAPSSCQEEAWNVQPAADDLPPGWSIAATQYDLNRKTMSFTGPFPQDEFSNQASVISTITCFEHGAEDAVARSQQASEDADQTVIVRDDLGDQAYSALDDSGATFLQLRKGRVVVYLAGSPDASEAEVDQVASAFDVALGGDGGTIAPTVAPSDDLGFESLDPGASASPAAPDLVAMLPTQVGDITLLTDSATGSSFLGDDQGSRAVLATLRDADLEADDLRVAQAYDEAGASDLSILLVTVDGLPVDQTRAMVLDVWLAATGPGVTEESIELGGRTFARFDYGDDGLVDYVREEDDAVLVITTADPDLAEQAAAALP